MFFIANACKANQPDSSYNEPELIYQIASEFIGDMRSLKMLASLAEQSGMNVASISKINELMYSEDELKDILEKFTQALDGGTLVDYIAADLNKVAYKCGVSLDDYEVYDDIGADRFTRSVMGIGGDSDDDPKMYGSSDEDKFIRTVMGLE